MAQQTAIDWYADELLGLMLELATYGFTRNVQFIGILLVASFIILISIGLYRTILSVLENKSKNNKNKQS